MGCYGIGITRTIAAVIEQNYDADGIIWPWPVAPYHVHLVSLDSAKPEIAAVADQIEADLEAAGFEVLHDDREGLSPGVKFKDADLLGMPLRLTVGAKGLEGRRRRAAGPPDERSPEGETRGCGGDGVAARRGTHDDRSERV